MSRECVYTYILHRVVIVLFLARLGAFEPVSSACSYDTGYDKGNRVSREWEYTWVRRNLLRNRRAPSEKTETARRPQK